MQESISKRGIRAAKLGFDTALDIEQRKAKRKHQFGDTAILGSFTCFRNTVYYVA